MGQKPRRAPACHPAPRSRPRRGPAPPRSPRPRRVSSLRTPPAAAVTVPLLRGDSPAPAKVSAGGEAARAPASLPREVPAGRRPSCGERVVGGFGGLVCAELAVVAFLPPFFLLQGDGKGTDGSVLGGDVVSSLLIEVCCLK